MKFYRKKRYWFLVVVVVLAGWFGFGSDSSEADQYEYTQLMRGDVVAEVGVTGTVHPVEHVDMSFEQSGRVARVLVDVGDTVFKGQLLASLANGDVYADVAQAQARVDAEQARVIQYGAALDVAEIKLEELMNGSRPEELAIKQALLDTAMVDFSKTISDTQFVLIDAVQDVSYAVEGQVGDLFSGQQLTSYDLNFATCDVQAESDVVWSRYAFGAGLAQWSADVSSSHIDNDILADAKLTEALIHVSDAESVLMQLAHILSDDCTQNNTTFDSYRLSVDTARLSLKTTRNTILTHRQLLHTKRNTWQSAQAEYTLALAGPRDEVVAAQESVVSQAQAQYEQQLAYVRQAEASVSLLFARAAKTVIRSPFTGKVLKRNITVGEIAVAHTPVFRIATDGAYEIETYIAEVDVADVSVGQTAHVTLDAYRDDEEFTATVIEVEAAETYVEGVPTYKTTLLFDEVDTRIQSGMTANVTIIIDEVEDVVVTPSRSIVVKDGKRYLRTFTGGAIIEHEVEVGLRGSDGSVELTKFDVAEDEEIILYQK